MIAFKDLSMNEFEQIVNRSKFLRDELDNSIQRWELDYISEKLWCIKPYLSDWNVGFWQPSYIKVRDYYGLFNGIKESVRRYGCSSRVEKKISHCEKLRDSDSNLFMYHCSLLKDMWYKDEIESIIDYVEDCGMELYYGKVGEKSRDSLDLFFDDYIDYLYDDDRDTIYKPMVLEAV